MFGLLFISMLFVGCAQSDIEELNGGMLKMKRVSISADMGDDTRASLDSTTGAFTWQSGDLISVLATDGKFYDFILTGEYGTKYAEFVGEIPEGSDITTVATYPRMAANGAENTICKDGILSYNLPTEWTYAKDVSNVPMVAAFEQGAEKMSFKQIGGVLRFPVKNLPLEATFVVTFNDATVTGAFPVELATIGQATISAVTEGKSVVTINYSSDIYGQSAEFNIPVPVGTYNDFNVTVKDAAGETIFTKDYQKDETRKDNVVDRASLIVMKDIEMPEHAMTAEVWPFFTDARIVFNKIASVTEYALYIDGATEPVIKPAADVDFNDNAHGILFGQFAHATTHTVAIAKVINGSVVEASKSEAIEFTTAGIRQLTTNTGTKFVTVGWDDVAVANGTKFVDGKWTAVANLPTEKRGYQVQLLAADKSTIIYDMIPFEGHSSFAGTFSNSSWLGKINGTNISIPTALAFGYLEPNTDYYFRVKTLDEAVTFDANNGNYNPDNSSYTLCSERGGCGWSDFVKLTTDQVYVPTENEILYEGFNDIMANNDLMNWAPGVVPDLAQGPMSWDDYTTKMNVYPEFLKKSASERKWTTQIFSESTRCYFLGLQDVEYAKQTYMTLNANACSLEGWSWKSNKNTYGLAPLFGAMRIGQFNGTGNNGAELRTPVLNSDLLSNDIGTKCTISYKLSYGVGAIDPTTIPTGVWIEHYRTGFDSYIEEALPSFSTNERYQAILAQHTDAANYTHYQEYYELSCDMYLKNGDSIGFVKPTGSGTKGTVIIDDIKITVHPGQYENNTFVDDGVGTEPDDTNYDVFGLGEFPISYWYNIPTAAHNYDPAKTLELYQDLKDSGINIVNYYGETDASLAENKRILEVCNQLGLKFIGRMLDGGELSDERIAIIKEHLASNPAYIGEYLVDEPSATAYDQWGDFAKRYLDAIPDKETYINLYPTYSAKLGVDSYEKYIQAYLNKIPSKSLSYDFYGLMTNPGQIAFDYYQNLDVARSKTLAYRMPFWVITQAGAVTGRKQPTEVEERWSVWTTIAGGSKGISYFCYWTPPGFDEYMVTREGVKTEMYYWIQQLNADINTIGKKLLPCHADGAILSNLKTTPLYDNGGQGRTKYGPITRVSAVSEHVICGCFRDARISENGENWKGYKVLLAAQSPTKDIHTRLYLDSAVTKVTVTQNNTTKVVEKGGSEVSVADGNSVRVVFPDEKGALSLYIPQGEALLIEF